MRRIPFLIACLVLANSADAQQSTQIRLDKNTCAIWMPRVKKEVANPLYAKALAAKKAGRANPMQLDRVDRVEFHLSVVRHMKCKGAP